MTIKILLHHVLVKLDDAAEADDVYKKAKAAGIVLELDKRQQAAVEYGTVIDVGPTAFNDYGRDSTILERGDRISFARYSGKNVTDSDGSDYLLLNDSDVLCVIV